MRPESIGKWLALGGIVVLVLSITPTGAFIDSHDAWWSARWQWMQHSLRQDPSVPTATINPILLYLGMLLSVGGLALAWRRDRGASTAMAVKQRARTEEDSLQIFIGGLPYTTTRAELRQLCEGYGEVERVHLMTNRETGRSRGFAFVTMAHAHEARAAIAGLQGTTLGGRMLTVTAALPRAGEERPQRPR